MALPTCGAVQFEPDNDLLETDQFKAPPGFASPKDEGGYIDRSHDVKAILPAAGAGSAFHFQYFLVLPFSGTRTLFGMRARSAPPRGCQLKLDLSIATPNGDVTNFRTFGNQTTAVTDTDLSCCLLCRPVNRASLRLRTISVAGRRPSRISAERPNNAALRPLHRRACL